MAKVIVKKEACIGCGICMAMAASVFAFGADGLAENVLGEEVNADLVASCEEAAASCPTQAIVVE